MRPEPTEPIINPYPETVMDYGQGVISDTITYARNWLARQLAPTEAQKKEQWEGALLDSVAPISMGARAIVKGDHWAKMLEQKFPKIYNYLHKQPETINIRERNTVEPNMLDNASIWNRGAMGATYSSPRVNDNIEILLDSNALRRAAEMNRHTTGGSPYLPESSLVHETVAHAIPAIRNRNMAAERGLPLQSNYNQAVDYPGLYEKWVSEIHEKDPKTAAVIDHLYSNDKAHGIGEMMSGKIIERNKMPYTRHDTIRENVDPLRVQVLKDKATAIEKTHDPLRIVDENLRSALEDIITNPKLNFKPQTMMLIAMPEDLTLAAIKKNLSLSERNELMEALPPKIRAQRVRAGQGRFIRLDEWLLYKQ